MLVRSAKPGWYDVLYNKPRKNETKQKIAKSVRNRSLKMWLSRKIQAYSMAFHCRLNVSFRMRSKLSSDWLRSYVKVTQILFEIFKISVRENNLKVISTLIKNFSSFESNFEKKRTKQQQNNNKTTLTSTTATKKKKLNCWCCGFRPSSLIIQSFEFSVNRIWHACV